MYRVVRLQGRYVVLVAPPGALPTRFRRSSLSVQSVARAATSVESPEASRLAELPHLADYLPNRADRQSTPTGGGRGWCSACITKVEVPLSLRAECSSVVDVRVYAILHRTVLGSGYAVPRGVNLPSQSIPSLPSSYSVRAVVLSGVSGAVHIRAPVCQRRRFPPHIASRPFPLSPGDWRVGV